jgi:hypothetical protein
MLIFFSIFVGTVYFNFIFLITYLTSLIYKIKSIVLETIRRRWRCVFVAKFPAEHKCEKNGVNKNVDLGRHSMSLLSVK